MTSVRDAPASQPAGTVESAARTSGWAKVTVLVLTMPGLARAPRLSMLQPASPMSLKRRLLQSVPTLAAYDVTFA